MNITNDLAKGKAFSTEDGSPGTDSSLEQLGGLTPDDSAVAFEKKLESGLGAAQKEGLQTNLERFLRFLGIKPEASVELQALGVRDGRYGDNRFAFVPADDAHELAAEMEDVASGTYVILHQANHAIFTRAENGKWLTSEKDRGTKDNDITHRRALFVDIDAKRPTGTSATDEEMAEAAKVGAAIYEKFVHELGPEAVGYGHSGNGRAVIVALKDIAETKELSNTIKAILVALDMLYSTDKAHVDRAVSDAKRLVPAFGTTKNKGAPGIASRPHRRTAFVCQPEVGRCGSEELEYLLQELRKDLPEERRSEVDGTAGTHKPPTTRRPEKAKLVRTTPVEGGRPADARSGFDAANGVPIMDILQWKNLTDGANVICPGCREIQGVGIVGNGFKCHHNRCAEKGVPGKGGFRTPVDIVCEVEGISAAEARKLIEEHFDLPSVEETGHQTAAKREKKGTLNFVKSTLSDDPSWEGVIAYDDRKETVVFVKAPPFASDYCGADQDLPRTVTDADISRILLWFERNCRVIVTKDTANDALTCTAEQNAFDEVKRYFETRSWDGQNRLDTCLSTYFGAEDSQFTREAGAAWLVSAVARTYQPGCKADHVLVLEGDQGSGKSTALSILAGKEFFCDTLHDLKSKDGAMQLQGKLIIELSELEALKRNDSSTIKAFLSRTTDRYRTPYDRRLNDHKRRCVFAGSVNDASYLADDTGNRRFWPVKCGKIDITAIERDRDQLWAEAAERYKCGEPWWLSKSGEGEAREAQENRHAGDPWEEQIARHISRLPNCEREGVNMTEVLSALGLQTAEQNRSHQMRCATVLQRLGWAKRQIRRGKQRGEWRYFPGNPPSSACSVQASQQDEPQADDFASEGTLDESNSPPTDAIRLLLPPSF